MKPASFPALCLALLLAPALTQAKKDQVVLAMTLEPPGLDRRPPVPRWCCTPRGAVRHVFSMRKANDREQARFAPYFGL